jgi:hypothetical protein
MDKVIHHRRKVLESNSLKVFQKWVLRRIFGPIRDEVIEGWRKLHNEELHNLYSASSITGMIKLRRMRWTRKVACMGEKWSAYRILVGRKARTKETTELDICGIILKQILERMGRYGLD